MPINDDRIAMSIRLENELYVRLRDHALETGATHQGIVERAIKFYLDHITLVVRAPSSRDARRPASDTK